MIARSRDGVAFALALTGLITLLAYAGYGGHAAWVTFA